MKRRIQQLYNVCYKCVFRRIINGFLYVYDFSIKESTWQMEMKAETVESCRDWHVTTLIVYCGLRVRTAK